MENKKGIVANKTCFFCPERGVEDSGGLVDEGESDLETVAAKVDYDYEEGPG